MESPSVASMWAALKTVEIRARFYVGSASRGFFRSFIAKLPPSRRDGWNFGISILLRLQPERSAVFVGPDHLRVSESEETCDFH